MNAVALVVVLVVLVLLLTGTFLPVAGFLLQFVGWFLVAVISLVLAWRLFGKLLRPSTRWLQRRSAVRDLRNAIAMRKKLGYETENLERKLEHVLADPRIDG